MKQLLLATAGLLAVGTLYAQQAQVNLEWDPHRNAENLALRYGTGTLTPVVHDDRTVTFKIVAPKATNVKIAGFPDSTSEPMGLWS